MASKSPNDGSVVLFGTWRLTRGAVRELEAGWADTGGGVPPKAGPVIGTGPGAAVAGICCICREAKRAWKSGWGIAADAGRR